MLVHNSPCSECLHGFDAVEPALDVVQRQRWLISASTAMLDADTKAELGHSATCGEGGAIHAWREWLVGWAEQAVDFRPRVQQAEALDDRGAWE